MVPVPGALHHQRTLTSRYPHLGPFQGQVGLAQVGYSLLPTEELELLVAQPTFLLAVWYFP